MRPSSWAYGVSTSISGFFKIWSDQNKIEHCPILYPAEVPKHLVCEHGRSCSVHLRGSLLAGHSRTCNTPGPFSRLTPAGRAMSKGTFLMSPLCFRKKMDPLGWKGIWPHLHRPSTAILHGDWSHVINETTEDDPCPADDQSIPDASDCFSTISLEAVNHRNRIQWDPGYCYLQRWASARVLRPPRIGAHCSSKSDRMEYEITPKYAHKPQSHSLIPSSCFPQPTFPQVAFMYVLTAIIKCCACIKASTKLQLVSVL